MPIEIRAIEPSDVGHVRAFLVEHNGALRVVSRGHMHDLMGLPGILAESGGSLVGLLTYHVAKGEFEVVTLHAAPPNAGTGTKLLAEATAEARRLVCRRLWLITTNDNEPAIRFYERRGMRLVAVHRFAIRESRKLKPEIPLTGLGGIPIEDEIEYELRLGD